MTYTSYHYGFDDSVVVLRIGDTVLVDLNDAKIRGRALPAGRRRRRPSDGRVQDALVGAGVSAQLHRRRPGRPAAGHRSDLRVRLPRGGHASCGPSSWSRSHPTSPSCIPSPVTSTSTPSAGSRCRTRWPTRGPAETTTVDLRPGEGWSQRRRIPSPRIRLPEDPGTRELMISDPARAGGRRRCRPRPTTRPASPARSSSSATTSRPSSDAVPLPGPQAGRRPAGGVRRPVERSGLLGGRPRPARSVTAGRRAACRRGVGGRVRPGPAGRGHEQPDPALRPGFVPSADARPIGGSRRRPRLLGSGHDLRDRVPAAADSRCGRDGRWPRCAGGGRASTRWPRWPAGRRFAGRASGGRLRRRRVGSPA